MKVEQQQWSAESGWKKLHEAESLSGTPQLVLAFASTKVVRDPQNYQAVQNLYPGSPVLMCSTSGEIFDITVNDDSISTAALMFENTKVTFSETTVSDNSESYKAGKKIVDGLDKHDLVHVMVFSDGLKVNGTSLVRGMTDSLPKEVSVTGGLVGDGADFKETLIGFNGQIGSGRIVAVGFYGTHIKIGFGSLGGWDTFGPERLITKSKENVLYELDGQSALDLYKTYLGEKAKELPGSGLLFPMEIRSKNPDGTEVELVRTLLSVDENEHSMTFAGDMPEGVYAKLMKANFDRLIDGAAGAASLSVEPLEGSKPDLAILISCVGRKLVLKERIEEEIEAIRATFGDQAALTGFYSYGEICPTGVTEKQCQLHNQTMTITTFREI
ncbi:MAG: FIST C-terminal domain-containing protein [Candidatus Saccharibacteria bacterium]|nr:FIST C-terminal domain-containing protein [Candidatus Saccharibacteria bacterium]